MRRFWIPFLFLNLLASATVAEVVLGKESSGWRSLLLPDKVPNGWAAVSFDDSGWSASRASGANGMLYRRRFHVEDFQSVEHPIRP